MKFLFIIAIIATSFIACTKDDNNGPSGSQSPYLGTYFSTTYDTAIVTSNKPYLRIEWALKGHKNRLRFDSVEVAADGTFKNNEIIRRVTYTPPYYEYKRSVGTGSFNGPALQFHFVLGGTAQIIFSGIKD